MKKISLLIAIFFSFGALAQQKMSKENGLMSFKDSKGEECEGNVKNFLKEGEWKYSFNGKLQRTAYYSTGILNGNYVEFYNSGSIKFKGQNTNGKRTGIWNEFYEVTPPQKIGKKKSETTFSDDTTNSGHSTCYFENGKIEFDFSFKKGEGYDSLNCFNDKGVRVVRAIWTGDKYSSQTEVWNDAGKIIQPGEFYVTLVQKYIPSFSTFTCNPKTKACHIRLILSHDIRNSWDTPNPIFYDNYDNYDNQDNPPAVTPTTTTTKDDTTIYNFVDIMPAFPGEEGSYQKFVNKTIQYPDSEKLAGKQGTVYVSFIIEKDGRVTNVKIQKGIANCPALNKEAIRVISKMPKWSSGQNNGTPVRVQVVQPIKFILP